MVLHTHRKQKIQDADETPFDPTGSDFDPSVDNVGQALRELDQITIDTLTEFEAFESPSQESTTSNSFVTKSGYPYTTSSKSTGFYAIDYTTQVGQGSNNKISQMRVQWRQGTSGTWIDLIDTQSELRDVGFVPWSGFSIVELTSAGVFQVRIQYANPGAGSCIIKEANIKVGKVSD